MNDAAPQSESTQRFSTRVGDYVKHRPDYPAGVVQFFRDRLGLLPGAAVADVGSGTGISAAPLLAAGYVVHGVEPNEAMRRAAEAMLGDQPAFHSVNGTAEATTLPDRSVDAIVCAQAFHWFDREKARHEFRRIGRPQAWTILLWNDRRKTGSPFLEGYERLLNQFGTDYRRVDHSAILEADLAAFLGDEMTPSTFANQQVLDLDGLLGRAFSSSYTPLPGQSGRAELEAGLRTLFANCQTRGHVTIEYETKVYAGRLSR